MRLRKSSTEAATERAIHLLHRRHDLRVLFLLRRELYITWENLPNTRKRRELAAALQVDNVVVSRHRQKYYRTWIMIQNDPDVHFWTLRMCYRFRFPKAGPASVEK